MKRIARSAIVECSADALYALVEDIESYPDFLPWCAVSHVRERSAGRTVATISMGASKIEFRMEYEFASRVVARALEPLFKRIADSMVEAVTERAAEGRGG